MLKYISYKMWVRRGMEKISWVDRKTNEEILNIVQEDRKITEQKMVP